MTAQVIIANDLGTLAREEGTPLRGMGEKIVTRERTVTIVTAGTHGRAGVVQTPSHPNLNIATKATKATVSARHDHLVLDLLPKKRNSKKVNSCSTWSSWHLSRNLRSSLSSSVLTFQLAGGTPIAHPSLKRVYNGPYFMTTY